MKLKTTLLAACAAALISATNAYAVLNLTITEVGSDVVVSATGSINYNDLTLGSSSGQGAAIRPDNGFILIGANTPQSVDFYTGISGPANFGDGGFAIPSGATGQAFGVNGASGSIIIENGYVSGAPLSNSNTYAGATLASLGITAGSYEWTWGSGGNADSITINAVPEPGTYAALLGLGVLGFVAYRRRTA